MRGAQNRTESMAESTNRYNLRLYTWDYTTGPLL